MTPALFATLHTLAQGGTLRGAPDGYSLTDGLSGFTRRVRSSTVQQLCLAGYLNDNLQLTPTGHEYVARVTRSVE